MLSVLIAGSAFAQRQGGLVVQNPLDEIRDALAGTLEDSGVPFTEAQVRAIALVMDEQLEAAEHALQQASTRYPIEPASLVLYAAVAERQGDRKSTV